MKIVARRIANCFDDNYKEEEEEKILPRNIDEIKNLDIFSTGLFNNYNHMLLIVKDVKLSLIWFKLTYNNIPIIIIPNKKIINYAKK